MKYYSKTDKGLVRDLNQDYEYLGEVAPGVLLAIVCDGMGGALSGEVASKTACESIKNTITNCYYDGMTERALKNLVITSIEKANETVYNLSLTDQDYEGMGTTVVAALINDEFAFIGHAGDSRAYFINNDGVYQLTRDHSIVQTMIENGEITKDQANNHPKKNLITRALGADSEIRVDFCQEDFLEGTTLLMCTDGFSNCVTNEDIKNIISKNNIEDVAKICVDIANIRGGNDNVTVTVIQK